MFESINCFASMAEALEITIATRNQYATKFDDFGDSSARLQYCSKLEVQQALSALRAADQESIIFHGKLNGKHMVCFPFSIKT